MLDYQLIDSGHQQRLERWGDVVVIRPDPAARWNPQLPPTSWQSAQANYVSSQGKIGSGHWQFTSGSEFLATQGLQISGQLQAQFKPLCFQLKFMPSKHLGLFPEHEPQWQALQKIIMAASQPISVLKLFAYTGGASLACAQAGATITHVDSSYEAIGLARTSQQLSGLATAPIRWIKEDVVKFVHREVRRGKQYAGIILDPPAYGHGTHGETWQTKRDLYPLLQTIIQLLSPTALFLLLNTYTSGVDLDFLPRYTQQLANHLPYHHHGQLSLSAITPHSHSLTTGNYDFWLRTMSSLPL